ncbi:hypothetical protein H8959_020438 [Pygathrix nigripes]
METRSSITRGSLASRTNECQGTMWAPTSPPAGSSSPSQPTWKSLYSSLSYSEGFHYNFAARPRRFTQLALAASPEPQLLRLRPSSLRTQDISHLLTGVFRNLYSAEVIGDEVSASLIKARGSENKRHEEFVDQLQQIRELYKQRLDEFEMLERHIAQAQARAIVENERVMSQVGVQDLESLVKLPPVKSVFRWCIDSELLRKHRLISPEDYYTDTVPVSLCT